MKIAYICTEKLPSPAVKGGAIQMMMDGISPFLSKKHDLTIFSVTDPELPNHEVQDNVQYIRFPRENYRFSVAEELEKHNFDIIHVFNRPKNVVLYKSAAPNSKFVLSLHNDMFSSKKISNEEGQEVIEQVSYITTVSKYIKHEVLKRFPEANDKIKVVYSGVDLSSYPPVWSEDGKMIRKLFREKFGVEDKKVILFVGRLSNTKGPHLLIRALEGLLKLHDDVVLMIVGGKWFSDNGMNSYVEFLYKLAEPIKDKVIFTKFISPEDIPNMFLLGDIFVCSSQWNEPLARVHYEAMAAGIPLITTNRGGNAEVVINGYNGVVIDQFNLPSAFAKAIHQTLLEPDLAEMKARNGREDVESMFEFEHVADRYEQVYLLAYDVKESLEIN
ncbi:glycosyltransferase family 4 protein [Bacillus sp. JJ1562]|uniref:glycosyltransferase family 4 protein n=1 Tax=Bacillus sp. JJ1562 TaxID=3122960 RepID=UPI0030038F1A